MTADRRELLKSKLATFFSARSEIRFAYLFGSVARGTSGNLSDIDIAVYLNPERLPPDEGYGYRSNLLVELRSELAEDIDLVILNDASAVLKFQVLKNGMPVYCCSEIERIRFHEQTTRYYLDLKPILKVQGDYLRRRLAGGTFGGGSAG